MVTLSNDAEKGLAHIKTPRKGVFGWMMFDWAAQPFFTVVTTFIFGPYVIREMVDDPATAQSVWTLAIAIAGISIGILSPILGSIADKTGPRKPWIALFATVKIAALLTLWFAAPGSNLIWVLGLFIIATMAAEFSIVFNDSMLPQVVSDESVGKVSNIAWGLGYAGGMSVLIIVLVFLAAAGDTGKTIVGFTPALGLDPANYEGDRATPPLAALWYLVFILPMFFFTPDRAERRLSNTQAIKTGAGELINTIKEARKRIGIFRFLIARMIYQDGVSALLGIGGVFAALMFNWQSTQLGLFGIMLNVAAVPSCLIAAKLDASLGSKKLVIGSIIILLIATVGIVSTTPGSTLFGLWQFETMPGAGLFASGAERAYIFYGVLIGIAFGPVQASSRSYLARSITPEESGKFFGLYAFAGRATSFIAPASVALITWLTASPRIGVSVICLFFLVGLAILWNTPYPANKNEEKHA